MLSQIASAVGATVLLSALSFPPTSNLFVSICFHFRNHPCFTYNALLSLFLFLKPYLFLFKRHCMFLILKHSIFLKPKLSVFLFPKPYVSIKTFVFLLVKTLHGNYCLNLFVSISETYCVSISETLHVFQGLQRSLANQTRGRREQIPLSAMD